MRRRFAQRIHDAVEVILRVGMKIWIPHSLLAEHDLAIHHRGHFAIASAEIEADAASIEMAPERFGHSTRRRKFMRDDNLDGMVVNFLADDVRVELARGRLAKVLRQLVADCLRPIEKHTPAAPTPQKELHQPLDINKIARRTGRTLGKNLRRKIKHRAIGLLNRQPDGLPFSRRPDRCNKRTIRQNSGAK